MDLLTRAVTRFRPKPKPDPEPTPPAAAPPTSPPEDPSGEPPRAAPSAPGAALTFFHCPRSRSSSILWLLEELEIPYVKQIVDVRAEGGAPESYRSIHPHKKVPAIVHRGLVVTERAAICIYLADAFPAARLAPPVDDPRRAAYLSWLVYCDAVFDPALAARMGGWRHDHDEFSFGALDEIVAALERRLVTSRYAAGDRFTAADTQLASGLAWAMYAFHAFPRRPAFLAYLARCQDRPGYQRYLDNEGG